MYDKNKIFIFLYKICIKFLEFGCMLTNKNIFFVLFPNKEFFSGILKEKHVYLISGQYLTCMFIAQILNKIIGKIYRGPINNFKMALDFFQDSWKLFGICSKKVQKIRK